MSSCASLSSAYSLSMCHSRSLSRSCERRYSSWPNRQRKLGQHLPLPIRQPDLTRRGSDRLPFPGFNNLSRLRSGTPLRNLAIASGTGSLAATSLLLSGYGRLVPVVFASGTLAVVATLVAVYLLQSPSDGS